MRIPRLSSATLIGAALMVVAVLCGACASGAAWSYPSGTMYDYDWQAAWGGTWEDYFFNRTPFEGYTIVHNPVYVGKRWEDLTLRAQARRFRDSTPNPPAVNSRADMGSRAAMRSRATMNSRTQSSSCDAQVMHTARATTPHTGGTQPSASHSAPHQTDAACRAPCRWCLR